MSCRAARSSLRAYPLSMGSKAGSKFLSSHVHALPGGIGIAAATAFACAGEAEAPLEPRIVFRDVAEIGIMLPWFK